MKTELIKPDYLFEVSWEVCNKVGGIYTVADSIAGMVGFVGRCYVDDGKHYLSIKSDEVVYGGGRLGINNVVIPLEWDEVIKLFEKKDGGKK